MADVKPVQLPRYARGALWLVVSVAVAAFVLLLALPLLEPVGTDVAHKAIRSSAHLPVVMWCFGWPIAFVRQPQRLTRMTWALGCVLLIQHIAIAFHLGHGWSHTA